MFDTRRKQDEQIIREADSTGKSQVVKSASDFLYFVAVQNPLQEIFPERWDEFRNDVFEVENTH